MALVNCKKCGSKMNSAEKYCSNCGAYNTENFCSECGKQIITKGIFCTNCGFKLDYKNKSEVINREIYNNYIPFSPIKLLETQIIKNNDKLFIKLKFKNLTKSVINSICVDIKCYDNNDNLIEIQNNVTLININIPSLEYYWNDQDISIANNTNNVAILIKNVNYDNKKWENDSKTIKIISCNDLSKEEKAIIDSKWTLDVPYKCIPKKHLNYWQCACGEYNDLSKEYCGFCGIYKDEVFLIFDKEKILDEIKNKEETEAIELEKQKIEEEESKRKIQKNAKFVNLIMIFLVIITLTILTISSVISQNEEKDYIMNYCEDTIHKNVNTVSEVINNYSCGTLAMYLRNNNVSESDAYTFINSENIKLYKDFKNIQNKELLEYINIDEYEYEGIINIKYLDYLNENSNYKPPSIIYNNVLNKLFLKEDYDNWKKVIPYLKKYNYKWLDADNFFTDGYAYEELTKEEKAKKIADSSEYSAYYHEKSGRYDECFTSDLYNANIVKQLVSSGKYEGSYPICLYAASTNIETITPTALQNYVNSGADLNVEKVGGTILHNLVFNSVYFSKEISVEKFEEKLKILVDGGANINHTNSDTIDFGFTPLDKLLFLGNTQAKDFQIYRILKKYGAICGAKCDGEKKYAENQNQY